MSNGNVRPDYRIILQMIQPHSSVLDLGCGSGELLELLVREKSVSGQGIEIDEQAIYDCVAKGLDVFHGDIDSGLSEFRDRSFDYVVLNQSLQQVKHFESVFIDALRVGKKAIVGLPNFAYYKSRAQLFFLGRAPVTATLPYSWYESPNIHFFSLSDFTDYCRKKDVRIERREFLDEKKRVRVLPNLFANAGIFLVSK